MIDALIAGRLIGKPTSRTARNGSAFAIARLRAADGKGDTHLISVIAFNRTACAALLALEDGDSVALCGELSIGTYTAKDGTLRASLDLTAHAALTEYHVDRRRRAMRKTEPGTESASSEAAPSVPAPASEALPFDDEIPF